MTQIAIPELRNLCLAALKKTGLPESDAALVTDHYLENELSGKASHGMVRVIQAVKTLTERGIPARAPEIVTDTGSMAVIDTHGAPGPVAGHLAVELAAERAKQYGIALIGARHYIANSGAMAYYLRRLADAGLIAIMSCNSEAIVCPPGGYKPMVGTNPVGLTVPDENGAHFIADFATSAIAYGKLLVMKDKGQTVPEGLIVDQNGHPSTNPDDALAGAIRPLADYRGFALALMVEMMAGPLIGAMACKRDAGKDGLFIIAIDPARMGHSDFGASTAPLLDAIRQSPPAPGADAVTLPGDRSRATLERTLAAGVVNVADKTLEKLRTLA